MSLSARVLGPNAVERSSSGSKEVSILGNTCMEYKDAQMADGIKRNSFRGARAQVYTYLATIYTTLGLGRATPGPQASPGRACCTACGEH
jgi:hypothetical protein